MISVFFFFNIYRTVCHSSGGLQNGIACSECSQHAEIHTLELGFEPCYYCKFAEHVPQRNFTKCQLRTE